MNDPLVSILIPTHNREKLLKRALDSCLAQTYKNLDIVVLDDGGDGDSHHMVSKLWDQRVRYLWSPVNRGECSVRGPLLSMARGEYACWQDDDDVSNIHRIECQVRTMQALDPPFLRTNASLLTEGNKEDWREKPKEAKKIRMMCNTAMFRVDKALEVDYDPDIEFGCDVAWELAFTLRFGTGMVFPRVLYYRDMTPPDRLSKKFSEQTAQGRDGPMRYTIDRKAELTRQIKESGIERWPTVVPEATVEEIMGKL